MIIANQTVIHKAFGRGNAAYIDGAYISVCFPCGEKRFVFPDAFGQFLRFEDPQVQSEVEEMIETLHEEKILASNTRVEEMTVISRENKARVEERIKFEAELAKAEQEDDYDEYGEEAEYADEVSAIFDWSTLSLDNAAV